MKKLFTFAAALAVCASVSAEELIVFSTDLKNPEYGDIGLCGLGISPNGKYVCGPLQEGVGVFVASVETGQVKWQEVEGDVGGELRNISNNGTAVGYAPQGAYWNFADDNIVALPLPVGVRGSIAEGITEDGKLIVGSIMVANDEGFSISQAAYIEEGSDEWVMLPIPQGEDLGGIDIRSQGSAAKQVSSDGSVILGFLGSFTIPIVWYRQADGTYEYDFFPARYLKMTEEDRKDNSKPLLGLSAQFLSVSGDGHYLCLLGKISDNPINPLDSGRDVPVIYDTRSKQLIIRSVKQEIDQMEVGLYPIGITNNATIIGCVGQPVFRCYGSFIWYSTEDQAQFFNDVFPEYNTEMGEADHYGFGIPAKITPDGTHIVGYVYNSETFDDMETPAYYQTYVIVTEPDVNSIEEIGSEAVEAVPTGYFNVEGQRLDAPVKGLNIVRMSDGSSRKMMLK